MNFHVFAATSQAVRAYLDEQALPERLAALGKPLLVIFGENDRRWRPSSAADRRPPPALHRGTRPAGHLEVTDAAGRRGAAGRADR